MTTKLGARKWTALILIGLFGQFAWTIENMYFNVFLYNTISTDPGYIAAMVGWSAAAATLTTPARIPAALGRFRILTPSFSMASFSFRPKDAGISGNRSFWSLLPNSFFFIWLPPSLAA